MAEKRHKFFDREWLNLPHYHMNAFIQTLVEVDEDGRWLTGEVTIMDCGRQISLDLDLHRADDEGARENALRKLHVLVDTLENFREEYMEALEKLEVEDAES